MDDSRKEQVEKVLELGAKGVEVSVKVLGWALIVCIALVSAILNGGRNQ